MGKSRDHFRMAADRTGDAERRAGNRHEADELEVQALGEHVDGIVEAVRNMKLSLNGRQLVGGIIDEVDVQMGKRVRR